MQNIIFEFSGGKVLCVRVQHGMGCCINYLCLLKLCYIFLLAFRAIIFDGCLSFTLFKQTVFLCSLRIGLRLQFCLFKVSGLRMGVYMYIRMQVFKPLHLHQDQRTLGILFQFCLITLRQSLLELGNLWLCWLSSQPEPFSSLHP